ncbi:hypothetical protein [Parasedimentitalea psychrophila]|uniref:Uncharacterized protein n=1 Tax=Parasedimentitalea psychrophila TaxID=2997337 RepID=A0A9Y2P100_9RHOB|nr:hypothetical protein [Parasedimentitalea psychrophila]WIY23657.1 hypothetical protein QPJ95_13465 [Parasedimentitalea psychrophila]
MRFIALLACAALMPLSGFAESAKIAGTDGTRSLSHIDCAARDGQPNSSCPVEILPKDDGSVTLRVLLPGGQVRYLYVTDGKVTATDSTGSMASKTLANSTIVHITPAERFEIPNSLMTGK